VPENGVFYFYYCMLNFLAYNFFPFYGFELEFCVLWIPYRIFAPKFFCLHQHFLLILKPNANETAQKTRNILYKCVLFYIRFRSRRIYFFKKFKIVVLLYCTVHMMMMYTYEIDSYCIKNVFCCTKISCMPLFAIFWCANLNFSHKYYNVQAIFSG
jgi:hypothetical protein